MEGRTILVGSVNAREQKELPMNKIFFLSLILSSCLITFVSCRSSKSSEDGRTIAVDSNKKPSDPGPGLSPDHCRIIATVVSIENLLSGHPGDPCSKAACTAAIRVDEILGYGSGFNKPLSKGSEIRVRFLYTLASTKELFPAMNPGLPGLKVGSSFEADLFAGEEPIATEVDKRPILVVGLYKVR